MLRSEAEALYGECMYDKFEVPAEVTELSMVHIQGLSLHATPNKCLPSTKAVGSIQVSTAYYLHFLHVDTLLQMLLRKCFSYVCQQCVRFSTTVE
jgi:hypothetical protein